MLILQETRLWSMHWQKLAYVTACLPHDTRPQYAVHPPEQQMGAAHLIEQNSHT